MTIVLADLPEKPRIIISRTDNIGDVILTFPLAFLLKQRFPDCHITYLARRYTEAVINACPDIDAFIAWEEFQDQTVTADVILHVHPQKAIARWAKHNKIPYRIGSTHRWYHLLNCNIRLPFSRRNSDLHEAQLNLKLLQPFAIPDQLLVSDLIPMIRLRAPEQLPEKVKSLLHPEKFNLIIHPGSNGNTREWPTQRFVELAKSLPQDRFHIILTGSTSEAERFRQTIIQQLPEVVNSMGQLNLNEFFALITACDGLVAGSTGPLHIAAALEKVHTLGLYPAQAGKHPRRWGPIGKHSSYLVTDQACQGCADTNSCVCMQAIATVKVKQHIMQWQSLQRSNT